MFWGEKNPYAVPGLFQPLVEQASHLAFQFSRRPVVLDRLNLVKSAFIRFICLQKHSIVGPRQIWMQEAWFPGFPTRCVRN